MSTLTDLSLRETLEVACADEECSLDALTVLSDKTDPFRVDTPARRRDGEWFAEQVQQLGLDGDAIHLRGLHYMLVSSTSRKPEGTAYANTDDDWDWLQEKASKAARWLGLVPFERIVDHRNDAPEIALFEPVELEPFVSVGFEVDIPTADEALRPGVGVEGFDGLQRHKLVFVGEKSSLRDVLEPIATEHEADLYLPTGDISDTQIYDMAKRGAQDGRRLVVLYFADCDPGGWHMPISVGRKLQALRVLHFPELDFEVRRVALTPPQVRAYGLPSTPLKATEKRADRWQQAMGVEQTEIDALAALQPHLLEEIAREAIGPFFDYSLASRVASARREWVAEAQEALAEQLDTGRLAGIYTEGARTLLGFHRDVQELNERLAAEVGDVENYELPEPVIPDGEITITTDGEPLIDSEWSFAEQSRRLKADREYEGGEA